MLGLIIALAITGHLAMWVATSRVHYRHWEWEATTEEGDKRFCSGFWGLLWPLTLFGYALVGLGAFIGWATVHPSLKETREKRRQQRKERLADLGRQIEAAEAELRQVTAAAENGTTADDAAMIRMMAGASFGPDARVVLPSGRTVTGSEMQLLIEELGG